MPSLTGPHRKPASGAAPRQLVVLLHGWGADGANLIDIADVLARALPDAQFIAPNAPQACEVNPFGYQWFSLMDRHPQHMLAGMRDAATILNVFLDEQLATLNLSHSDLALVGFSQGAMLALHAATHRAPAIACVVGFSGALVGAEALADNIVSRPPACLIHGEMDDVVPFAAMAHAAQNLEAHGVPVAFHRRPFLGHGIDAEGIEIAKTFLESKLAG